MKNQYRWATKYINSFKELVSRGSKADYTSLMFYTLAQAIIDDYEANQKKG